MSNRVLIVGEAPGRTDKGLTRRRVGELAGAPYEEWADWVNVFDDYPGPAGKGSAWSSQRARAQAAKLRESGQLDGYDCVVLLGRRVAQAMIPGGAGFPFFRWTDAHGLRVGVIPHTSGIVRNWNDPAVVEAARAFLAPLAAEAVAA